jgi:hypothetical protein
MMTRVLDFVSRTRDGEGGTVGGHKGAMVGHKGCWGDGPGGLVPGGFRRWAR